MPTRPADRLFGLSDDEQRRVVLAGVVVVAMRLGLWVIPYRILRRMVEVSPRTAPQPPGTEPPAWVARYIVAISRYVPQATCLTQALAAHLLLRREGFKPQLQLGVARDEGVFKAHAWIECNGMFIVGDFRGSRTNYTSLKSIAVPAQPSNPLNCASTGHTLPAAAAGESRNT
jgi:hypothetical protein